MIIDFRVALPSSGRQEDGGDEGSGTAQAQPASYMSNYARIYAELGGGSNPAAMVTAMEAAGIDHAVLQAEWDSGDYRAMNDEVANIVEQYPGRLTGYCTVNPGEDDDMAAVVEREVTERGFRGVNLQGFAYRLAANDKRFYPLYQKCQELGIPVTIHSSINFSNNRSIAFGRPLYLCDIACDFPDLTIVANHGGWPWVPELAAIAWKHRNVYIEIGGVAPKYLGVPGAGWETLLQLGNTLLQDQVLFATDSVIPFERAIRELRELPLKPEVTEKWLGGNAAELLRIA